MSRGVDGAVALAARWRLRLDRSPRRGHAGRELGRATGSSLEFEDRRGYVPGDDLRHLDWRTYARTDELLVRRYREEIQPRVELVLDLSRSMTSDPAKARLSRHIVRLIAECAQSEQLAIRVFGAGDIPVALAVESILDETPACDARLDLAAAFRAVAATVRPMSHVVVVSDLLTPVEPRFLLGPLTQRAGTLTLIQVLSSHDAAPEPGAFRLSDAETANELDLVLDERAIDAYRVRLERYTAGLREEARRSGGRLATLVASAGLDELCRSVLQPAEILEPRAR